VRQPLVPVVRRAHERLVGGVVGLGRAERAPAQRDVGDVAVVHRRPGARPRALEADPQVGGERQLQVMALRARRRLPVARPVVGPLHAGAPVVQDGLALHVHLHRAVHAADHPQQHVVGVVVRRGAAVGGRAVLGVVPRPDEQDVADDDPARPGAPRRLEDHRARQVPATRGHRDVGGGQTEGACRPVQERAEDRRAVHARQAHPLDVAAGRHERGDLAVREERVLGDGREGRAAERHVGGGGPDHARSSFAHSSAGL
jgi:hypothetical protein